MPVPISITFLVRLVQLCDLFRVWLCLDILESTPTYSVIAKKVHDNPETGVLDCEFISVFYYKIVL